MKECLELLMRHQRRSENEFHARLAFEGQCVNKLYGEELSLVLQVCTPWVAATMKPEYEFAMSSQADTVYQIEVDANAAAKVRSDRGTYMFNKVEWVCDCDFASTLKPPCRHVMFFSGQSPRSTLLFPYQVSMLDGASEHRLVLWVSPMWMVCTTLRRLFMRRNTTLNIIFFNLDNILVANLDNILVANLDHNLDNILMFNLDTGLDNTVEYAIVRRPPHIA
ncbi:hypothetical protein PPTG_11146 [Phytophthora nicotianae INRA-310]|uniref:SWIM-type domain-containing protein n=1 Tax=Phytophthora nicotianae (strain INRA-310) TaxID=761204 RepID=W2Q7G4_PHYN3|nr:hypothetical protein PPTG_11146 [Phytophthora nicotianae INRA-310]ETN09102.1 hypothetical protein PPTG_11146 [Phytophthora nicotianae INRA-310]